MIPVFHGHYVRRSNPTVKLVRERVFCVVLFLDFVGTVAGINGEVFLFPPFILPRWMEGLWTGYLGYFCK